MLADWFCRLFADAPVSMQLFGPDGRCLAANSAWERLFRLPSASAVGYNILEDERLARSGHLRELRRAFDGERVSIARMSYDVTGAAGARVVSASLVPLPDAAGTHVVLTLQDVGASEDAARRAEMQFALTDVLARSRNADEAIHGLLSGLGAVFDARFAAHWVVCPGENAIVCSHTWTSADAGPGVEEFAARSREYRLPRGGGLPGSAWQQGEAIWLGEVLERGNFPRLPWMHAAGLQGGFAFPIVSQDGLDAVVELFSVRPLLRDQELARLADSAGRRFGLFLQRRRLEDALHESEEANRAVVQSALDAIVAMDAEGRIVDFNPAAERMFGFSRAEVVGREMAGTIIPAELRNAHRAGLKRQRETGASRIVGRRLELSALRSDGTVFPVELTITRTQRRHEPLFIGFLRDVTERRRHEQEREAMLARERAARDAAEAANRSKDEFIATVSHELRTPISAIRGWLKLLGAGSVPADKIPDVIGRLDRNAEMQSRLVDDLLDASTLVTGRMRFTVDDVNLREIIENACESLKPAARAKHLTICVEARAWVTARGDAVRLQQVFWNLLSNAVKFTPPGGAISVMVTEAHAELQIAVMDTGSGIPADLLPSVFDKFRQGSPTAGGLGLGLAIVKHIVEAHAGTVVAANRPDGGAIFTVTLPRV